jgi:hypothetical protein
VLSLATDLSRSASVLLKLAPGRNLMEYICSENNQDVLHLQGPPGL